jgi:NAD(P)-dependent dehydrogenase (short-subunit alcohol dehydrogenase family)
MNERELAVVIGAGSGIGKATVQILLREGFHVLAGDCSDNALQLLRRDFNEAQVDVFSVDIAETTSRRRAIEFIKGRTPIHHLIISAGQHSAQPAEFLTDDAIEKVIAVNLTGHMKFVRDVIPLLSKGGKIIGLSSLAGSVAVPMSSVYSASKFGLEGFYEALSVELRYRGIHAVLIQPGNVNSGFNEKGNDFKPSGIKFLDEGFQRVTEKIHSRYGINPDVVAKTILKAVLAKRPCFSYQPGLNSKKAYFARSLLGRTLARKLMARHFGF